MWEIVEYKVGDKVVMTGTSNSVVSEVIRITPKGFIVVKPYGSRQEYTFRKDGVERTSDAWHKRTIRPLTQHDIDLINISRARKEAKKHFERCYEVLTKEQAEAIIELLEGVTV